MKVHSWGVKIMAKVALQAGLCYNEAQILLCLRDASTPLRRVTSTLLRRLATMDIIPQDNTPRKQCSNPDCENPWLPATTEFFYERKGKHSKDGLNGQCKE